MKHQALFLSKVVMCCSSNFACRLDDAGTVRRGYQMCLFRKIKLVVDIDCIDDDIMIR